MAAFLAITFLSGFFPPGFDFYMWNVIDQVMPRGYAAVFIQDNSVVSCKADKQLYVPCFLCWEKEESIETSPHLGKTCFLIFWLLLLISNAQLSNLTSTS